MAKNPHIPLAHVTLVIGKGGVGKTTIASGLAALSPRGATLVEFMDGESGNRVLYGLESASSISRVEQVIIEPQRALEELTADLFHSELLARVITGNFAMKRLFRAAPALRELAQLEVIRKLAVSRADQPIVVDMPATGHGLAWLKVAKQLETLLISGPLQRVAKRLNREFLQPQKVSIVLVTLPERMVLQETTELATAIEREVGLKPSCVLVNAVPNQVSEPALEEALRWSSEPAPLGPAAAQLYRLLSVRKDARVETLEQIEVTAGPLQRFVLLPRFGDDPSAERVAGWLRDAGVSLMRTESP